VSDKYINVINITIYLNRTIRLNECQSSRWKIDLHEIAGFVDSSRYGRRCHHSWIVHINGRVLLRGRHPHNITRTSTAWKRHDGESLVPCVDRCQHGNQMVGSRTQRTGWRHLRIRILTLVDILNNILNILYRYVPNSAYKITYPVSCSLHFKIMSFEKEFR